ncbi:MAG TPA: FtsX-like permease family protein, partial [Puia sp.]|nr:FtsX-like permease family protein [Puia sp.]
SDDPDYLDDNTTDISWEGKEPNRLLEAAQAEVTPGFVQTMKLSLIGGRDFSNNYPSDTASFLINETAAREIGSRNPIGRTLTMWGRKGRIIGVLKDFNFKPVRERIIPLVLFTFFHPRPYGTILVRTRAGKTRQALSILQSLCRQTNPGFPFTYQFSAESYLRSYQNEQVVRNLADIFSLLATIVSCLGLFGLASFTTEQRTKEIGIRKVLGASTQTLFLLVSREFLLLVGIALMIAAPLAWYLMTGWLGNYAYRTSLAWWIFPFAGGIAFFITVLTVGFQSAKVAIVNPVKCLRSE